MTYSVTPTGHYLHRRKCPRLARSPVVLRVGTRGDREYCPECYPEAARIERQVKGGRPGGQASTSR